MLGRHGHGHGRGDNLPPTPLRTPSRLVVRACAKAKSESCAGLSPKQVVCRIESDESRIETRSSYEATCSMLTFCSQFHKSNQLHINLIIIMNFAGRYQLSGPSPFPVAKDENAPSLPMRRNLGLRVKPNKTKAKKRSSLTKRRHSRVRSSSLRD